MSEPKDSGTARPYAVLGAGQLTSHLQRIADESGTMTYQFNLFRIGQGAEVTHALRPGDLVDIVKICQVLAFTIADDGWLPTHVREELLTLADDLAAITRPRTR